MAEVRYNGKGPAQRIADRLRNSGEGLGADVHTQTGTGPQRVHHNVFHSSTNHGAGMGQGPGQGKDILRDYGPDVKGRGR